MLEFNSCFFFVSRGLGLVDLGVEGLFGAWGAGLRVSSLVGLGFSCV